ncbi:MAG: hypothetical protein QM817_25805 [Archangium sp.]
MIRLASLVVLLSSLGALAADDDTWPGENRRFHVGVGLRGHGGAMFQRGATFLLLESDVYVAGELRVGKHHAIRLQLSFVAGWPNAAAGETNVSFRFGLTPRVSLGVGVFANWGIFSLRGGVEIPLAFRFGGRRAHEIGLSARVSPGVFNNVTFVWWDFSKQAFALSVEGTLGYTFFF